MQYSLSEQDIYFLSLFKRTPHLEELADRLRMKGFPSIVQVVIPTFFNEILFDLIRLF